MRSKPAILAVVCLAVLAINLDTTIVNVALPSIATELDADTRHRPVRVGSPRPRTRSASRRRSSSGSRPSRRRSTTPS